MTVAAHQQHHAHCDALTPDPGQPCSHNITYRKTNESVITQDSLDLYHDAYSTLQRPHYTNGHASASTHALPAANRDQHCTDGYRALELGPYTHPNGKMPP